MSNGLLVLDIFDGGRLLTRGFEHCGFCVVGGPEQIYGQDLTGWRPPKGRFDGIIGGPPCQRFSQATNIAGSTKAGDLIPEFCGIIKAAQPGWFVMENVRGAPLPEIEGYQTTSYLLNRLSLGTPKRRIRRFTFGAHPGLLNPYGGRNSGLPRLVLADWNKAMAEVLPRSMWPSQWFPTHPLDPPAAPTIPVMPTLQASEGRRHETSERRFASVGKWLNVNFKERLSLSRAWAAMELPGDPPALWKGSHLLLKAGAVHLLGNGVPFDMACHVARAVSIAVLGSDTGSVVRWPANHLMGDAQ